MPAGHDTPQAQAVTHFLMKFVKQKYNIDLSYEQAYAYYIDLADNFDSAGTPIVTTDNGKSTVNTDFVTAFTQYAQTGTNPLGESGTTPTGTGFPTFPGGGTTTNPQKARDQRHIQDRNNRATFRTMLQNYGFEMTGNLNQLVNEAVVNNYSTDRFLYYLRQTPEYHQQFPGIFNSDGTLKMTEAQYMRTDQQFQSIADRAGINYTDNLKAFLFKNDVSVGEAQTRAAGIKALQQNDALFKQFGAELVKQGVATKGEVTQENLLKFALGELSNKQWYDVWNDAVTRNAAVQSGIEIGKHLGVDLGLSRNQVLSVADKGFSPGDLQKGFSDVAQHLLTTLPESRIQHYGLTKQDILQAVFGGKNQAIVKKQIDQIMANDAAFAGDRAYQQSVADSSGNIRTLGGISQRAQSA